MQKKIVLLLVLLACLLNLSSCTESVTPERWSTEIEDQLRYSMSACLVGTIINEVPNVREILVGVNDTAALKRQKEDYIVGSRPMYEYFENMEDIFLNVAAKFYYDSLLVNIPSFEISKEASGDKVWTATEQNYNIRLTVSINKDGNMNLSINEQDIIAFCVTESKKEVKRIEEWCDQNEKSLSTLLTEVAEDENDIDFNDILYLRVKYPISIPVVKNGLGEPTGKPTTDVYSAFAYSHYQLYDSELPKYVAELYAKAKEKDEYEHIDLNLTYKFYNLLLQLQRENKLEYLVKEIKYSSDYPVNIEDINTTSQLEKNISKVLNFYFYGELGNGGVNECEELVYEYLDYID